MPLRRILTSALALTLALAVLAVTAGLVVRDDPRDRLRQADALLESRRYHAALAAYAALLQHSPDFAPARARVGMLRAIRGERQQATTLLAGALAGQLSGTDADLVRLYQGFVATQEGSDPIAFWALIGRQARVYGVSRVLAGQYRFERAEYAGAEAALREALEAPLPPAWGRAAHTTLALLRASSDPARAQQELDAAALAGREREPAGLGLAAPLAPQQGALAERLQAILEQHGAPQALLLGQLYLQQNAYPLAEAQFAAVDAASPEALPAAAFAAYTRWRSGDEAGGLEQLRALAGAYPDEPRARSLLALALLEHADADETRQQLAQISALAPGDPAVQLAWGQWYVSQQDYVAAATAFSQALALAPLSERGTYALHLARFRLVTGLDVCQQGLASADEAARLRADDPLAWLTLGQIRSACHDAGGAVQATRRATQRAPQSAEAWYRYGQALAATGSTQAARDAYIQAADAEPASQWRARAEDALAALR